MENPVYASAVAALTTLLGTGETLASGNGVRFKSARRGKATIYHSNIALGNQAEIAFEVSSMANRLGMSEGEFRSLVASLRNATGRPVQPNPQYNWPRIGIFDQDHVGSVIATLQPIASGA